MKIVALLTGRGNNTLKDKNVLPVLGKPLLYYPAMAAKSCSLITDFYVSSDDDKILDAAAACGYKKIRRPDELALPTAQHKDVIVHALKVMKEEGIEPDILIVLLANSAIVKTEWIELYPSFWKWIIIPIVQNVCVQMVVWIHGLILKENRFQPIDKIYQ